jgi:AraC family transcriptional regulator of adaptative response / DNA-3-methyladenine glycosylase II
MRRTYAHADRVRRLARTPASPNRSAIAPLAYRPPALAAVLAFLSARATPGVEFVDAWRYRRTITVDGAHGVIDVPRRVRPGLSLEVASRPARLAVHRRTGARRVRSRAEPSVIAEHLRADPLLRQPLARHLGIRVPAPGTASSSRCGRFSAAGLGSRRDDDRRAHRRHVRHAGLGRR